MVGGCLSCLPQVASQVIRWPEGMCKVQSKCKHIFQSMSEIHQNYNEAGKHISILDRSYLFNRDLKVGSNESKTNVK